MQNRKRFTLQVYGRKGRPRIKESDAKIVTIIMTCVVRYISVNVDDGRKVDRIALSRF